EHDDGAASALLANADWLGVVDAELDVLCDGWLIDNGIKDQERVGELRTDL
ncbi:hypothetical protein HKX48_002633, partial [Thoreauomyces humboldtii]